MPMASYSHDAVVGRKNADLANNLGNLAQRSLSMVAKNLDGAVPQPGEYTDADRALLEAVSALFQTARSDYAVQDFHHALEATWAVLGDANAYFADQQPWVLRKTDPERMATVLYVTLETVRRVALLVQPVMPGSATRLLDLLGVAATGDAGRARRLGHRPAVLRGLGRVPGAGIGPAGPGAGVPPARGARRRLVPGRGRAAAPPSAIGTPRPGGE